MIAFDPDELNIEQDYKLVPDPASPSGTGINLHYQMTAPEHVGTAYIRIDPKLRDFLKLCNDKHGVIGFEYDFDEAGLNLGLILKKEAEE